MTLLLAALKPAWSSHIDKDKGLTGKHTQLLPLES
jgi:hypothetical protein